ncbi:MAG TPA: hypothetical protein VNI61_09335 [Gemmatimonadales bacterium]|nr:hypothetical protein [Gemmatimonadales bacterium]
MRNYWLRIAAGAFGIFAAGMLLIAGFRRLRDGVAEHLQGTDPISLPLAGLVPFSLDREKLGSVDRVELLRSEPERIARLRVIVELADSAAAARLGRCRLALDDPEHLDQRSTFRCETLEARPAGFEPFGTVVVKGRSDSAELFVPVATARRIRSTRFWIERGGLHVESASDSLQEALDAMADSLESVADSLSAVVSDSIARGDRRRADSLRAGALREAAAGLREHGAAGSPSRDSIRAMVERALDSARLRKPSTRAP